MSETGSVERVAIKGGTLYLAINTPFISPGIRLTPIPIKVPIIIIVTGPAINASCIICIVFAESTEESPITNPTDRSIPPVIIT